MVLTLLSEAVILVRPVSPLRKAKNHHPAPASRQGMRNSDSGGCPNLLWQSAALATQSPIRRQEKSEKYDTNDLD
jgi:hypothetical protein